MTTAEEREAQRDLKEIEAKHDAKLRREGAVALASKLVSALQERPNMIITEAFIEQCFAESVMPQASGEFGKANHSLHVKAFMCAHDLHRLAGKVFFIHSQYSDLLLSSPVEEMLLKGIQTIKRFIAPPEK